MGDHLYQNFKQSFSLANMDPDIELMMNHVSGLNQDTSSASNFHSLMMGFPHDNFLPHANLETLFTHNDNGAVSSSPSTIMNDNHRKRKTTDMSSTQPETSSAYSSPQVSHNGITKTNRALGGSTKKVKGKGKGNDKDDEKPGEVIHVRAKRGQATDSHSLAERVRRGKINERIRCLQDIVPGCYKTMGMAVMLDEIINYVQSLQNQVEFLSMKLTAASAFHDFNSDTDDMEAMQRAKAFEALKSQNVVSQQQQQQQQQQQFAQLCANLGYCPQLPPHNR